jgi:hypothetical protein
MLSGPNHLIKGGSDGLDELCALVAEINMA